VGTPQLMANTQRGMRDPKLLIESSALGRLVQPEEIGKGVAFLLSDDASEVTGINLPVEAG
jgi:NAD(P)-dependent dehydrogenase (short-subunit alcohol dehydrogenase family)